jgi:hypothetical protein
MFMAMLGGLFSLTVLARWQDRQLARLRPDAG